MSGDGGADEASEGEMRITMLQGCVGRLILKSPVLWAHRATGFFDVSGQQPLPIFTPAGRSVSAFATVSLRDAMEVPAGFLGVR
ncbi:hypothetical protein GCM10010411_95160 [Actinomadura fulvescens]|uniref:Uncharacterized protein n=1 Tax=Actinomadura fulvescens TaxID=46160 RepID=A0ABN3R2F5_9ACTN